MANKGDIVNDGQLVLVATDPHIDDLVVSEPMEEDTEDLLPARVFQMPVKVAEDDKVETKMAALIMVDRDDLPAKAQKLIQREIDEVASGGDNSAPVVPQPVTSEHSLVLPPFDPYYYVGKLPSNFANSLTTNVSTNSLSMQKVTVDPTKLVDMLTMARLSTQLSSINDSIHSFVETSEESPRAKLQFRGDTSGGLYSSSPCQSPDNVPSCKKSEKVSEKQSEITTGHGVPCKMEHSNRNSNDNCETATDSSVVISSTKAKAVTVNNFVGEVDDGQSKEHFQYSETEVFSDCLAEKSEGYGGQKNVSDIVIEDVEDLVDLDDEMTNIQSSEQQPSLINILPQEIMQRIFAYLSQYELVTACALVCKCWKEMAYDPIHWQTLKLTTVLKPCVFENLLARCRLLKSLELCGFCIVYEEMIASIGAYCPMLASLDLSFCDEVTFKTTEHIGSAMPLLEKLNVEGCQQVDGLCVHSISQLANLTSLNLSHCSRVNSTSVIALAKNIKKLQHLNIDGIPQIKDEAVSILVSNQSENLRSLHLDGAELTDISMFYLLKCKNLTRLLVSFSELLTDKALLYVKEMTWLRELQLRKCDGFTNEAIYWLFDCKTLSGLTDLNLSECTGIMDNSVIAMVECCGKSLRNLSLGWCYNIGDIGIEAIVDTCCNLEVLDLLGLDQVYGYTFIKIPETMPKLTYLNLQQCHKVVDSLILVVIRRMPNLVALNYYGEEFRYGSQPDSNTQEP